MSVLSRARTSQQHLLQQAVDPGHAEELHELDLLYHLPGDALQRGQQEEDVAEPASGVILAIVDVVLQVDLDLEAHVLHLPRLAQAFAVWEGKKMRLIAGLCNQKVLPCQSGSVEGKGWDAGDPLTIISHSLQVYLTD